MAPTENKPTVTISLEDAKALTVDTLPFKPKEFADALGRLRATVEAATPKPGLVTRMAAAHDEAGRHLTGREAMSAALDVVIDYPRRSRCCRIRRPRDPADKAPNGS